MYLSKRKIICLSGSENKTLNKIWIYFESNTFMFNKMIQLPTFFIALNFSLWINSILSMDIYNKYTIFQPNNNLLQTSVEWIHVKIESCISFYNSLHISTRLAVMLVISFEISISVDLEIITGFFLEIWWKINILPIYTLNWSFTYGNCSVRCLR